MNPQFAFAHKDGGTDTVPSFITADGPVREARFINNHDGTADGGVHALFTISGRAGAESCQLAQPDFARVSRDQACVMFNVQWTVSLNIHHWTLNIHTPQSGSYSALSARIGSMRAARRAGT